MCFIYFSETITIIFLNSIRRLVLSLYMQCVSCELGSEFLKIIWKYFILQRMSH
jgi:hypothetical protein